MAHVPCRTALSGPAFIRLLTRLAQVDAVAAGPSLPDTLSQWLGWTEAIALSGVLGASVPAAAPGGRGSAAEMALKDAAQVRAALADAISAIGAPAGGRRRDRHPGGMGEPMPETDYAVFRERYVALQQMMETAVAGLRGRLRAALAAQGGEHARLAALDAVMERVLGPRERQLLGGAPALLQGHFERLRDAPVPQGAAAPWSSAFRLDMQSVLRAELEVRLQPVEGLLAALPIR